jgi:hypothetical protein
MKKKIEFLEKWGTLKHQLHVMSEQNEIDSQCEENEIHNNIDDIIRANFNVPSKSYITVENATSKSSLPRIYISDKLKVGYWDHKDITIMLKSKHIDDVETFYLDFIADEIKVDAYDFLKNKDEKSVDFDFDYFFEMNRLKVDMAEQFIYQSYVYQEILDALKSPVKSNTTEEYWTAFNEIKDEANKVRDQYLEFTIPKYIREGIDINLLKYKTMNFQYKLSDTVYLRNKVKFFLNKGEKTYTVCWYNESNIKVGEVRSKVSYVNDLIVNYLTSMNDVIAENNEVHDFEAFKTNHITPLLEPVSEVA